MLLDIGAQYSSKNDFPELSELTFVKPPKNIHARILQELKPASRMMILKDRGVIIADSQLTKGSNLEHVIFSSVIHIVDQCGIEDGRPRQRGEGFPLQDYWRIYHEGHVLHDHKTVLEIMVGVVSMVVEVFRPVDQFTHFFTVRTTGTKL